MATKRANRRLFTVASSEVVPNPVRPTGVRTIILRRNSPEIRGDSAAAEKYFAAGMQAAGEARVWSPLFLSTLVLAHQKRNDEAAAVYRQFLEQEESSPSADAVMVDVQVNQFDAPEQAAIAERRKRLQVANMFAGLGQWRDAQSELEAIETASAPDWWKDEDDPWTVLGIYGETYEGLGDYPAAGGFFGDAVVLLAQRRQSLRSDAERIAFAGIASVRTAYYGPARVALRRLLDQPEHAPELEAIYPGSTLLENESFTRERFYEHFRDTAVVHAATHGFALMRIPQLSSILLPKGEQITVHEIARDRLRTDLLVLSACHTGSGMLTQSDEVLGFERALLVAGARRLVLSLWEANDLSTTLLMRQFHRSYANGASAADSLRTAQLWLRDRAARDIVGDLTGIAGEGAGKARDFFDEFDAKQKPFEHPFFWAPFTCVARDLA